jgi:hypothetical protein
MKIIFRIPVNMLCDRNPQDSRISNEAMLEKLGCTGKGLSLGGEGRHPEPSTKFFIYFERTDAIGWMPNKFRLVEVNGFEETIIDEGKADHGFAHNFSSERPYSKLSIKGEKLGVFNAYIPLVSELTISEH